jgi:hypothetical protein
MMPASDPLSRNAGEGGEDRRPETGKGFAALHTLTHLTLSRQVPPLPLCGRG